MALLRLFPLTLLPALHGCSVFSSLPRQTLHIAVVEMGGVSATAGIDHAELAKPVVEAFRRLNPNVELRIRNLPEQDLVQVLRLQQGSETPETRPASLPVVLTPDPLRDPAPKAG